MCVFLMVLTNASFPSYHVIYFFILCGLSLGELIDNNKKAIIPPFPTCLIFINFNLLIELLISIWNGVVLLSQENNSEDDTTKTEPEKEFVHYDVLVLDASKDGEFISFTIQTKMVMV